ncbi:MAG TPA: protease pro-enzyme activation domain-containing protein, partial [Steroidobacteraceae bacterium]
MQRLAGPYRPVFLSPINHRTATIPLYCSGEVLAASHARLNGVPMLTGYFAISRRIWRSMALILTLFAPLISLAAPQGPAPVATPTARITDRVDASQRTELEGQVHRAISDSVDLGAADPALPAGRIVMVLAATPSQEADLADFLRRAQTPGSPDYHRWLTPEAFGQRFGVAPADLTAIRTWLQSRGFQLEAPTAGRRSIVFSGTIGQLNDAFATRMHQYQWHGERHLANSTNPTIPNAFSAVVRGFTSLDDFRLQPQLRRSKLRIQDNTGGGAHAIAPGDFATIYDLSTTYAKGITGAGRTIAIIGRSDVHNEDISNFRSMFGLPATLPTVVLAGADPGFVAEDQIESDLDLEWAGGVAPGATVLFVTANSTKTTDGIVLSSQFAVERNLADVITVSYSGCEAPSDVSGGTTFFNQLWQQAAAQGTSVFVSSGDSGAAGCDAAGSTSATHGPGINALCSSPYATCVGGTEFVADVSTPTSYWGSANTPGTFASALQYIGEAAWNQSGNVPGGSDLWSSGGGASAYFAKPAWQLSTGVPSDGVRDVPDVALSASSLHDPYLIYSSEGNPRPTLESIGGTSASAPSMAAIAVLVVQQQNGRVGSFAPVLYGLSDLQVNGGAPIFHRIISGNNSVPGQIGFAGTSSDPTYNEVTGLGSVDAGLLVAHWSDFRGTGSGLSPANAVVPAARTVGSATLLLPSNTAWSATVSSGASGWLTVTPASGTGSAP